MVVLPLFELPVGHSWANQAGLTLIGDAAHLMSPCAGEGVNVAMADALSLANAFVDPVKDTSGASFIREDLQSAVAKFEAEMFERAKGPAAQSYLGLRTFMGAEEPTREDAERMFNRSLWAEAQSE